MLYHNDVRWSGLIPWLFGEPRACVWPVLVRVLGVCAYSRGRPHHRRAGPADPVDDAMNAHLIYFVFFEFRFLVWAGYNDAYFPNCPGPTTVCIVSWNMERHDNIYRVNSIVTSKNK